MLRQPASQAPALMEQALRTAPPMAGQVEESKIASATSESNPASTTQPPTEPSPPGAMETSQPPVELLPTLAAKADAPASSRRSQPQPAAPDAPAPRATKAPSSSASRRVANPGTYETVRTANVFEESSASARIVAYIPSGTRVNVVAPTGTGSRCIRSAAILPALFAVTTPRSSKNQSKYPETKIFQFEQGSAPSKFSSVVGLVWRAYDLAWLTAI